MSYHTFISIACVFLLNIYFKAFPSSLVSPQFSNLKSQLEKGYLVCLSPSPFSAEIVIHGIRQDVDHVLKELQEFSRSYQQNKKQFYIAGVLAVQACKQWYGYLLDEIKELIRWVFINCQEQNHDKTLYMAPFFHSSMFSVPVF